MSTVFRGLGRVRIDFGDDGAVRARFVDEAGRRIDHGGRADGDEEAALLRGARGGRDDPRDRAVRRTRRRRGAGGAAGTQRGGNSFDGRRRASSTRDALPHLRAAHFQIEPCSRRTRSVPARSCRPSTFWVISVKPGRCGSIPRDMMRRVRLRGRNLLPPPVVPLPTRARVLRNACGVASVMGRRDRHNPPLPRNVGTPLAADTPAPVITVTRAAVPQQRREPGQLLRHPRHQPRILARL